MLALGLWPAVASASPLLELTGDPYGHGGLTGRASARGAAAAYFNPALLVEANDGLTLGFMVLSQQVRVRLSARADSPLCPEHACDVPALNDSGPESFRRADNSAIPDPTLPTTWLQAGKLRADGTVAIGARPRQGAGTGQAVHEYMVVGLSEHVWERRLTLALYTMFPTGGFMQANAFYSDEREQFFSNSLHPELYGDRLTASALVFGGGLRLSDAVYVGIGLTLAMQSSADAGVYVSNLSDLDSVLVSSRVDASLMLAPQFGLSVRPLPALRLDATLHSPQSADIETRFSYIVATGLEQRASQSFTHSFLPWSVALGAELMLGEPDTTPWSLAGTLTYALWSQYRDRHGEHPQAPYAWGNVLAGAIGLHHRGEQVRAFVDLSFQPTPVPEQSGRTNYVDNDRASVALGGAFRFEPWGYPAELGASAQFHSLLSRSAQKRVGADPSLVRDEVPDDAVGGTPRGPVPGSAGLQSNNPGFPGFSSDGLLWAATLHLHVGF